MAGYDPYAGHYAHLPGTTPPPQPHPVHSLAQQPYDDRTDPLQQPQDPFATPSYQLRDEPAWPTHPPAPPTTGDLADGAHHHHQQAGTFVGGVGAGTSLYPGAQYHPHQQQDNNNMSYDYLQTQQQQQGPAGGGTYDDDQAPLLHGHGQQAGLGWSTSGLAPGQADPSLQLPGGFDPTLFAAQPQPGPYGPPPQPSPGFGGPFGGQGPQQGYDDDAVVRYGRIPQRQPRRYKTVKRQSSSLPL